MLPRSVLFGVAGVVGVVGVLASPGCAPSQEPETVPAEVLGDPVFSEEDENEGANEQPATQSAPARSPIDAGGLFASEDLGIRFAIPPGFVVGSYDTSGEPVMNEETGERFFERHRVLIEKNVLGEHPADAIPVGSLPDISLSRTPGDRESFIRKTFLNEDDRREIGGHTVYRLGAFPGPYGDKAFYYVVDLEGGGLVEIVAHREYAQTRLNGKAVEAPRPTGYDEIVETTLIPSLEVLERR